MNTKKEQITISQKNGVTRVYINGEELHGIRKVSFEHRVNTAPVAIIEMYTDAAVIDSPATVYVNNAFKNNNNQEEA